MKSHKFLISLIVTMGIIISHDTGFAKVPEPDNIIYGMATEDASVITLKVGNETIASYTMGSNQDAGNYYILRVPLDALDPQEPGTARPDDIAEIYVNDESQAAVSSIIIGKRGNIQIINLNSEEDSDGDGLSDAEESQLGTNPHNPDTDSDGLSDYYEANNGTNPLLYDSDGDGYSDGYEVSANTNPVDENEMPVIYVDVENTTGTENGTKEYPFNTINEGIAAASDKYTVSVASGTYEEIVTISKDIRLIGKTPTTTIINAGGDTQALHCDYDYDAGQVFSIERFTVKNADNGINCADGSSPLIRNNIITGIDVCGIICGSSSTARIINNTISGNSNATAIQSSSSNITIVNNIISDNKAGIDCEGAGLRIDYNNLWSNTDGNYVSSTLPGVHDISGNPLFVDITNDDFHLMSGSPCLDAGDAMEELSGDYTGGDTISVDEVTNIAIGDRILITDGANVETDVVVAVTASTIRIQGQFANNYLMADGVSIFTDMSDARQEPEPGNFRIDMGAQGNTSEACAQEYHKGDINGDGDVDLIDAVLSLQVLTRINPSAIVHKEADVNSDGKIGKEEVIYILQKVCGLRRE